MTLQGPELAAAQPQGSHPGLDCLHCGDPADGALDCRSCGDPLDEPPPCARCHASHWRGLCGRCRGAEALAELQGFPQRCNEAVLDPRVDEWARHPDSPHNAGADWALRAFDQKAPTNDIERRLVEMEKRERRADWLQRANEEYQHSKLDTEYLDGLKHEGWANDRRRDGRGRPKRGAKHVPPLTARGHIERATRSFRLRRAAQHSERSKGAEREAKRLRSYAQAVADRVEPAIDASAAIPDIRSDEAVRDATARLLGKAQKLDTTADWHRGRARGQRERFHELKFCGAGYAEVSCRNCEPGNAKTGGSKGRRTIQIGCSVNRACVRCRDRRANNRRPVFWRARGAVLHTCKRMSLTRRKRHGGRWCEKDFTLTLPDALMSGKHAVEHRIAVLFSAWREFSNSMSRHFRSKARCKKDAALRAGVRPWWHAAWETTPGADGFGHPHWHVWIVCPFVSQDLIREWWAAALRKEGIAVSAADLIKPVLREVKCESIVNEVFKGKHRIRLVAKDGKKIVRKRERRDQFALGKDGKKHSGARPHHGDYIEGWTIDTKGKKGGPSMSANVQARVYMALEGRRTVRCTSGFLKLGYKANCCPACGEATVVVDSKTGEVMPALEASVTTWRSPRWKERGPPLAKAGTKQKPGSHQCNAARASS